MKKSIIIAAFAAIPALASAQSAIDAYNLSKSDLRGTARFMSMAGAFTALGGDLSTLTQNPAGIGVYRGSDVGVTVDFNMTSSETNAGFGKMTNDKTHVYCNNFGYIGTVNTGSDLLPTFSWGASYNRAVSFDRFYRGVIGDLGTSMSNYIADFSNGYSPSQLGEEGNYNPFQQPNIDWLSIMGYNTYMINPTGINNGYTGLYIPGTTIGDAQFSIRERGYVDEYAINFGGNIMNTLYWGLGFGITDLSFTQEAFYDEQLTYANVYDDATGGTTDGDAYNTISNYNRVTGSGFNMKFGLIFKPVNEFRLGFAIHTPTWYQLTQSYNADMTYSYGYDFDPNGNPTSSLQGDYKSDYAGPYDWRLKSPWRLMFGAASVVGGRFIISADYEYTAFNNMTIATPSGWGDFETLDDISSDVKTYFRASNTLRIGTEFRVTPQFSLRAGYSYVTSNVKNDVNDGNYYIYTSGTNPAYTFDQDTNYVSFGLGYRTGGFYIDAAYVYKNTKSTYHAFSPFEGAWQLEPYSNVKLRNNNIVLTLGYKF